MIRIRDRKKKDVWLLTNELSSQRLSRQQAGEIYRWRWHIEGTFRTYKRTQSTIKLRSRTEALVYREAEVSLLALQLLLAGQMRSQRQGTEVVLVVGSARQGLLRLRGDITMLIGAKLGPRQQVRYQASLPRCAAVVPGRRCVANGPDARIISHQNPRNSG